MCARRRRYPTSVVRAIELVAAFERSQAEEEHPIEAAASMEDGGLEDGEFWVEARLNSRVSRRNGNIEFLVRWGGFGEEEDSWEPADGLPQDMVEEFDVQRAARASKRARRS